MSDTQIHTGENIFDVAIREYGHIEGALNLIKDNGLCYSSDADAGTVLTINESVSFSERPVLSYEQIKEEQLQETILEANQNIYDIAIQEYGSIAGIFELAKNNNIGLSALVDAGTVLNVKGDKVEKPVYNYFKARSKPATGNSITVDSEPILEGIDYWAIEVEFEVQ